MKNMMNLNENELAAVVGGTEDVWAGAGIPSRPVTGVDHVEGAEIRERPIVELGIA